MKLTRVSHAGWQMIAGWSEAHAGWVLLKEESDPGEILRIALSEGEERAKWEKKLNLDHTLVLKEEDIRYLPLVMPSKILCVGLNYADHAKEFGDPIPEEPVIFCKATSSLSMHRERIIVPRESFKIDYEAELVAVIGTPARRVSEEEALSFVAGYTCGNDVSCRDWQKEKPAGQWFLGKSFNTFAPFGPALVTPDEVGDPNNLTISSRLNGEIMQHSSTKNFIFRVEKLVSYLSQVMTLYPGDLIFTGTPGGIGEKRVPPVYLKDKDIIEVEIERIGTLSNRVREEVVLANNFWENFR